MEPKQTTQGFNQRREVTQQAFRMELMSIIVQELHIAIQGLPKELHTIIVHGAGTLPIKFGAPRIVVQVQLHQATMPQTSSPNPTNGSTGKELSLTWSVSITDSDGDSFSWSIACSNGQSNSGSGASNGTKQLSVSGLSYSTQYKIWVNVTDSYSSTTRAWFRFTTKALNEPAVPGSFSAAAYGRYQINIAWVKGSKADRTYIECKNTSSPWNRGAGMLLYNNTGTSTSQSGLAQGTTRYYQAWSWNATSKVWSSSYSNSSATTASNHLPSVGSPDPTNQSTESISLSSLSISIVDSDGDNFDWNIETSPGIGSGSGTGTSNGTKTCTISGLQYSSTYHWYVNVTDGTGWTNVSYIFTTESQPQNNQGPGNQPPSEGEEPEQNHPPNAPIKPSGQTSAKPGMAYNYTSSTSDPDGDHVRLRFDWGDGTLSNWGAFVSSNTSVAMLHVWNSISTYNVRVIAQDENGTNSSWYVPLSVTVTKTNVTEEPSVLT